MFFESFVHFNTPFSSGFYQVNSAAGRFRLQTQRPVGRALIEAEPTMNTSIKFGKVQSGDHRFVGDFFVRFDLCQASPVARRGLRLLRVALKNGFFRDEPDS